MYPQPKNVQGKALEDRIDCSMQIVPSQQKCPLQSLTISDVKMPERGRQCHLKRGLGRGSTAPFTSPPISR